MACKLRWVVLREGVIIMIKKNLWWLSLALTLFVSIISLAIYIGSYKEKIENLDREVMTHSEDIKDLQKSVYTLIGSSKINGINTSAYLKAASKNNLPFTDTITTLSVIKNLEPREGKLYLMRKGFDEKEAFMVFPPSTNSEKKTDKSSAK